LRWARQILARAWAQWLAHAASLVARQRLLQATAAANLVALPQRQQRASLARAWGRWHASASRLGAVASKRAAAGAWARRWSVRNAERLCRVALRAWFAKAAKARESALRRVAQRAGRAVGARGLLALLKRLGAARRRRGFAAWLTHAKDAAKAAARREQVKQRSAARVGGEGALVDVRARPQRFGERRGQSRTRFQTTIHICWLFLCLTVWVFL
jgi:hypothetical protein